MENVNSTDDFRNIDVQIYPNPFSEILNLIGADECALKIFTENGVTVHTQQISSPNETIRMGLLPAGMYFLHLEKDGKTKTVKIVKMN